jgi:hypothetical protein
MLFIILRGLKILLGVGNTDLELINQQPSAHLPQASHLKILSGIQQRIRALAGIGNVEEIHPLQHILQDLRVDVPLRDGVDPGVGLRKSLVVKCGAQGVRMGRKDVSMHLGTAWMRCFLKL